MVMRQPRPAPLPRYPLNWEGAQQAVNDACELFMVPRWARWLVWAYVPAPALLIGASIGHMINATLS